MTESRTKKSIQNVITGLAFKGIGIVCPFMIRTIMIHKLGTEYLGLSQLFTSILQVLSLSEVGIGNAMVYSMYEPMAKNDTDMVCALLSLYRKLYRIIGLVTLAIGVVLLPFLEHLIKGGYPGDINIYYLYLIYLFNTVISYFLFAYKKSILDAQQKVSVDNVLHSVTSLAMYALQIAALLTTANYYVYIVFLPLSTIALNLIRNYIISKQYPMYICKGEINSEKTKELMSKVKALIGNKIGTIVLWFADSIVVSTFLGLKLLAIYSNYYYIMNAIIGIMAIVYNSILASVGNSIVIEGREKNFKDFLTLTKMNMWMVGWCSICLLCLYQPFMKLWMGQSLMLSDDMVILFVCYFYFWLFNKVCNTYINAAGLWKESFWKPYVSSITNLVLNIILVQHIGLAGVLISTIFASVFIETPWEAYVLHKYLFKKQSKQYYICLVSQTFVTVLFACVVFLICGNIDFEGIFGVIVKALACSMLALIAYVVCFWRTKEFKMIRSKIIKI